MNELFNDIHIDGKAVGLPNILKRQYGFVEDVNYFTRGFTRIYVIENELYIGHSINPNKTKIDFENLDLWITYFDRI